MMRATLKDIAASLGLSNATVSRGLRDDPKIPAATRERIKKAARELNYRPNALMSELAARRWQTAGIGNGSVLAFIIQGAPDTTLGPDIHHVIRSARVQASLLGYHLDVFNRADFDDPTRLQRALRHRGITDIILSAAYDQSRSTELNWDQFICVQLLPGRFRFPLHSVMEDHFGGVILAWEKAVDCGHKRIGIVLMDHGLDLMDDTQRLGGALASQRRFAHLHAIPPFLTKRDDTREAAFIQWVKKHQPDAIIGFEANHFYYYRNHFGSDIPYVVLHKHAGPDDFSGISEWLGSSGKEAVNLLHFCRRTHQWGVPKTRIDHVIEPIWYEGTTLKPLGK